MTPGADLFVRRGVVIPADELVEKVSRSGGPGGQNVNKVATRVSLRWRPSDSGVARAKELARRLAPRLTRDGWLVVHAESARTQLGNRRAARDRLADILREATERKKTRRKTKPTKASRRKRLDEKRQRSETKRMRRPPAGD